MARIRTYSNDTTIRDNDLLIGTDGGTGAAGSAGQTKNFPLTGLRDYFIGAALTDGFIPVYNNAAGTFVDSGVRINNDGELEIPMGLRLNGDIFDSNGDTLVSNSSMGTVARDLYLTGVVSSSTNLDLFTVYVITNTGMYNLPMTPPDGAWVKIVNLSGVSNVILNAQGNRFMNTTQTTLQLDDQTASFELVFVNKPLGNAPVGWVIVGAN